MILVGFKLVKLVGQLVSSLNQLIVILRVDQYDDHLKAGDLSPSSILLKDYAGVILTFHHYFRWFLILAKFMRIVVHN